jgi:hypothetical protein
MDAFREIGVDEEYVRKQLECLDWTGAMTAAEIAVQLPSMSEELFGDLADGAVFHNPDEVIAALRGETINAADMDGAGAESLGGPRGYGESTTGRLILTPSTSGGIGSGTDTGDTGSGNTEATGWGRAGTTFGEEAVKEAAEEEMGGEE